MSGSTPEFAARRSLTSPEQLIVDIVETTEGFARLAPEWDELLDNSKQKPYFMRWSWLNLWWQQLSPADAQLRILTCRDRGALVGLAPFYLRRHRLFRVFQIRELVFLGTGIELKTSENLDIIARRGYEDVIGRRFAAALRESTDWDRFSFCRVPVESATFETFLKELGARTRYDAVDQARYVDTSQGWLHYKQSLGRSMRRNVDYYSRRLFKKYQCEFGRIESADELVPALDALVRLHIARWESQGEVGSLAFPPFERFLRSAIHQSVTDGRARLWTLRIDGAIAAVLVGFLDGGTLHYFQKGHNPAYAKDDLGTAMLALCIHDCCDDPAINAFDFMGGGAPYKAMWAHHVRELTLGEARRSNVRTLAFAMEDRARAILTAIYRALVPTRLRAARRGWLKARNIRALLTQARIPIGSITAGSPHLESAGILPDLSSALLVAVQIAQALIWC